MRGVIAASICAGSIRPWSRSMSTNTGMAFWCRMQEIDAPQVYGVVMTSSPQQISRPASADCSAAWPELVASTWRLPWYFEMTPSASPISGTCLRPRPKSLPWRSMSAARPIAFSVKVGNFGKVTFPTGVPPRRASFEAAGARVELMAPSLPRPDRPGNVRPYEAMSKLTTDRSGFNREWTRIYANSERKLQDCCTDSRSLASIRG